MKRLTLFLIGAVSLSATDPAKLERDLNEIGRVASAMVDGDVCQRILTARARKAMERLGIDVDVSEPLSSYSIAIQQLVAIARALDISAKSCSSPSERRRLNRRCRR